LPNTWSIAFESNKSLYFEYFSGDYHISLTYNGEHIHDSPYYLNLRARPPTATIEPIEFYVN